LGWAIGASMDEVRPANKGPALMKRLAICIDDFGMHDGVNAAALQLAQCGRITAISCLVGAPSWSQGVNSLRMLNVESVDLGLHLDLTEYPLQRASRHKLLQLIVLAYCGGLDRAKLRTEIVAQFDAFENAIGRVPDYVDGHQHVHQLPVIREELLGVLRERCHERKPWLRSTRPPSVRGGWWQAAVHALKERFKPQVIALLGSHALARMAVRQGHSQNLHLLGSYNFRGSEHRYRKLLLAWLRRAGDRDLLMCHAGIDAVAEDPLRTARQHEYSVLSAADFPRMLRQEGIELAPLSRTLTEIPRQAVVE